MEYRNENPRLAEAQSQESGLSEKFTSAKPPRLINKREVIARVGLSYPSIWQWMQHGKFPRSRELGGRTVWLEAEIDDFIINRPIRRLKGDAPNAK